jgi:hypothetical protein
MTPACAYCLHFVNIMAELVINDRDISEHLTI